MQRQMQMQMLRSKAKHLTEGERTGFFITRKTQAN